MEEETDLQEDGEVLESCNLPAGLNTNQFTQSRATREPLTICSEESSNDNSDNSDEDSDAQCSRPKRPRAQPQLPASPEVEGQRKQVPSKYKVWSLALQEEALMETLTKCDVEAIDRERSVESYNYKGADKTDYSQFSGYHMPVSECHYLDSDYIRCKNEKQYVVGSKRRRHKESKRRHRGDDFRPRGLPQLVVTAESSSEEVAEDIALKLRESKVDLIMNIVLVLGKEKAIALYNETKGVEDNGGMLLMNQERRRTPGGVYFLLLKRDDSITSDAMKDIFASDLAHGRATRKKHSRKKKKKTFYDFKETLIREKLLCLNTTASAQDKEADHSVVPLDQESNNLEEGELTVTNPPPSPATDPDQDTPPSRTTGALSDEEEAQPPACSRPLVSYDDNDDYLQLDIVDDIDMF